MTLPFRHRLSFVERCVWLALALMLGLAISGHAQTRRGAARPHGRPPHRLAAANDDPLIRNHGTGVRVGLNLSALRGSRGAGIFEAGAFHQRALGHVGSVQGEVLFFRQRADSAATATGLRLPVLLVLNPFDNVSFHVGPEMQWQWNARAASTTDAPVARPTTVLAANFVAGGEARVGPMRVGVRYGVPIATLADLPALGRGAAQAWKTGQVQVYLGVGFNR